MAEITGQVSALKMRVMRACDRLRPAAGGSQCLIKVARHSGSWFGLQHPVQSRRVPTAGHGSRAASLRRTPASRHHRLAGRRAACDGARATRTAGVVAVVSASMPRASRAVSRARRSRSVRPRRARRAAFDSSATSTTGARRYRARRRDRGVWSVSAPVRTGVHRYAFLVTARWVAGPTAPRASGDDFGQPSSALVVEDSVSEHSYPPQSPHAILVGSALRAPKRRIRVSAIGSTHQPARHFRAVDSARAQGIPVDP
jgi:hypothetical protein